MKKLFFICMYLYISSGMGVTVCGNTAFTEKKKQNSFSTFIKSCKKPLITIKKPLITLLDKPSTWWVISMAAHTGCMMYTEDATEKCFVTIGYAGTIGFLYLIKKLNI